jgi:hypothetical protein
MGYIAQQMREYASGTRASLDGKRHDSIREIASDITAEETRVAAEYFAQIRAIKWVSVIGTELVPATYLGADNMRHAEPGGGMEPIGQRIIEIPEDSRLAELRDSHGGFIAYVPRGSKLD